VKNVVNTGFREKGSPFETSITVKVGGVQLGIPKHGGGKSKTKLLRRRDDIGKVRTKYVGGKKVSDVVPHLRDLDRAKKARKKNTNF